MSNLSAAMRALTVALIRTVMIGSFVACSGHDDPVPINTLLVTEGANIVAVVGQRTAVTPVVTLTDPEGRGVANVMVHWDVTLGEGLVFNDSILTDASGRASAGGWVFGVKAGPQILRATVAGVPPALVSAQATPGAVARLQRLSAVTQQSIVNANVAEPPSVRVYDQFSNPIPGVLVAFATNGSSVIAGAQKFTTPDGVATADSWRLGAVAGSVVATAMATGFDTAAVFYVTAIGSAPINVVALSFDLPSGAATVPVTGVANVPTCLQPSVKFVDAYGNPAGGGIVTFTPGPNSGTVTRPTAVSDNITGVASVGAWILGTAPVQTLVATSAAFPGKSIAFAATLVDPSPTPAYGICVRFVGDGGTARHREAVTKAVARWQRVVTGHVATSHLTANAGECAAGIPAIDENVSDLLIYVQITDIDGPNGVLGRAAPCFLHAPAQLTMMGFFQLDQADLDLLLSNGTLDDVVLHEMGHILGIGTLWSTGRSLLVGRGGNNPRFVGTAALDQFQQIGGAAYTGIPVPVENTGAAGTRDTHWRKTVFRNELMQGFASPGGMPLSRVTVGSLADLGYIVNMNGADTFTLFPVALQGETHPGRELDGDVADSPLWSVDRAGRRQLLKARGVPF